MEISIKEPCHENWSNMTPNEQGAFCGKCVKTVIDFTGKSLDEIKSFFAGRREQATCGRFEDKQLSALSFDAFFERFRDFEFTKRLAVILFFTFGLCLFGASPAAAQSDSLVKGDTMVKQPEPTGPVTLGTDTNIAIPPLTGPIITTMGAVSISVVQPIDWAKVTAAQPGWAVETVKKTGIRPAPLKRKPVDRRSD